MKTVRIVDGAVIEIIPDEATTPSVAYWYGDAFAAQCVQAPDVVQQGWTYNKMSGVFSAPEETEPQLQPTEIQLAQQDITDLQLSDIEQGQRMTDLEIMVLGGADSV